MTKFDKASLNALVAFNGRQLATFVRNDWTTITPVAKYYLAGIERGGEVDAGLSASYFIRYSKEWQTDSAKLFKKALRLKYHSAPKAKTLVRK